MMANFGAEIAKPCPSAHSSIFDEWAVRVSAIRSTLELGQETVGFTIIRPTSFKSEGRINIQVNIIRPTSFKLEGRINIQVNIIRPTSFKFYGKLLGVSRHNGGTIKGSLATPQYDSIVMV